jgi:hypothetical protein
MILCCSCLHPTATLNLMISDITAPSWGSTDVAHLAMNTQTVASSRQVTTDRSLHGWALGHASAPDRPVGIVRWGLDHTISDQVDSGSSALGLTSHIATTSMRAIIGVEMDSPCQN